MNLIDMYVTEVGEHLPRKMRTDIETEIRSLIEDTLEDRSKAAGRPRTDEMVVEVLKEFGSPGKVAASYLPEKYLVGPRLYPFFMLVLKCVLFALALATVVRLGVEFSQALPGGAAAGQAIAKAGLEYLGSAMQALGNIVLVFAILQRVIPNWKEDEEKDWDPRTLKPRAASERVKLGSVIAEVLFTAAAIVVFNFYPHWISFISNSSGEWRSVPMLTSWFFNYLPWLTGLWLLEIALNLVLLRQGKWHPVTHWIRRLLDMLGIGLGFAMLIGRPLVEISEKAAVVMGLTAETAARLSSLMANGVRMIILIIVVITLVELVQDLYKMWSRRSVPIRIEDK